MTSKNNKNPGRPTVYNPKLWSSICERLAGGESLRSVCRDEAMPGRNTVNRWLLKGFGKEGKTPEWHELYEMYTLARDLQAEVLSDELMDIADDSVNDYVEREVESGTQIVCNSENIARARLRVDTRKWFLSKVLPKKYGDRSSLDVTGNVAVTVKRIVLEGEDDEVFG